MKRNVNEEIDTDSDSELEVRGESDNDELYETEHQTKVRLKKEKIKKLEEDIKKRKVENVDEEVRKTLEEEALEKQGKLMKNIAKDCFIPQQPTITLSKFKHEITCMSYSIDGKFIFSGSRSGDIIKWDILSGQSLYVVKGGRRKSNHKFHCSRVTAIAACDEYLATGDQENKIFIWNISDLSLKTVLKKHRKPITSLVYRRHSQQLFSGDKKGIIFVWDMALMNSIEELLGHCGEITGLDSNLSNNCVSCSGIGDNTVRLWKVDTDTMCTYDLPKGSHELALECVSMVNERYFVAGSASNKLYLWDSVKRKTPISVISPAHSAPITPEIVTGNDVWVTSVCALKQSTILATGSNMSEVRLWQLVVGRKEDQLEIELLFVLPGILGCVNELRFSPDGKTLAVAIDGQHRSNRMQKRTPGAKSAISLYRLFK